MVGAVGTVRTGALYERSVNGMLKTLSLTGVALVVGWTFAADEKKEAGKQEKKWSFDADDVGKGAKGLHAEVGEWTVAADESAPSKPNVLSQAAKSKGSTFNLVFAEDAGWKDVEISVQVKAVAGEVDQGGGLVWRGKDARNYYVVRYNPLEDNYRVYKVVDGKRIQLQSADITASPGWHALKVKMTGSHIECYYDGKLHLDLKDETFKDAGKIGLWTKADAQTRFDDLEARGPGGAGGDAGKTPR